MNKLRLHGMFRSWTALKETRQLHELSLLDGMELLLQAEEQERDKTGGLEGWNIRLPSVTKPPSKSCEQIRHEV
ncbi:MAG: hypothetical protein RLO17_03095 [Cyclobacteriaceae bacterium]